MAVGGGGAGGGVEVGVETGVGVRVAVGMAVGVSVGTTTGVLVAVGVASGVGVLVGVAVKVGLGVLVGVGTAVGVWVKPPAQPATTRVIATIARTMNLLTMLLAPFIISFGEGNTEVRTAYLLRHLEAIAYSSHRAEINGPAGVFLDLPAQPANVNI